MLLHKIKQYCGVGALVLAGFGATLTAVCADALTLPAEGRLSTIAGGPVADGVYAVKFRLYPSKDAQVAVWEETWVGLQVTLGMFYAELGTQDLKSPITPELLVQNQELWLSIQVSLDPELPRVRVGRVPYAVHALIADKLAGPLDGKQIADGSLPGKAVDFPYAASNQKGGPAVDLQCTGCVGLSDLADDVLDAKNIAFNKSSVQKALTDFQVAVQVSGISAGIGKSPAKGCALDVASDAGELCIDGDPATVVRTASSDLAMAKYAKEGQIVFRSDLGKFYAYGNKQWKQFQMVAVCGDKQVDPPETCDDGNVDDTDACVSCQSAKCGDTKVQKNVEECDDGNAINTDACVACKAAKCGDGVILAGVEVCDGANIGSADCVSAAGVGMTGTVACAVDCKTFDISKCLGPLGSASNPAADCASILKANPAAASGAYTLKNGVGSAKAYCDMTNDGGGWTMVASWIYTNDIPSAWGTFTVNPNDPKPNALTVLPFTTIITAPKVVRFVYQPNGQLFSDSIANGAVWEKGGNKGVRIKLASGSYLIFENDMQTCGYTGVGWGICTNNGANGGMSCDGNAGAINGHGLFNGCSYDESGCGGWGWKINSNSNMEVCKPDGLVAVFLK